MKTGLIGCFDIVKEKGPVLVAVSGGSDSLALLFLASSWAKREARELHAVTVNHGLREEAESEAAFVSSICERLGVYHVVVYWEGEKPSTGIASAARDARYELMEDYALAIGARVIVTGHSYDDQAETIAMRLARGETAGTKRGDAGMCYRTVLAGGTVMLRPLLDVDRKTLREFLAGISQSWIEDPTNFDMSYERVQVRDALSGRERHKGNLVAYGKVSGRMRHAVNVAAAEYLRMHWRRSHGCLFECDTVSLEVAAQSVLIVALQTVISTAGGGRYFVPADKVAEIIDKAKRGTSFHKTLGRCIVSCRGETISVHRELRNLAELELSDGYSGWWDGRVWFGNDTGNKLCIRAMSSDIIEKLEERLGKRYRPLERQLLAASPVAHDEQGGFSILDPGKGDLPPQLEMRFGSMGLESFSAQWDQPLVDWLRNLEISDGAMMPGNSHLI